MKDIVRVEVRLLTTALPNIYEHILNCYTKDGMYCIMYYNTGIETVEKFPLTNIFKVVEVYEDQQ
jgi:hypothetical protein